MFKSNKYTKWYNDIISHRKENPLNNSVYQEKHHIIPKSLGGSNKKENIISLTAREHFVCHRLLVKMTEGKNKAKMSYAIRNMMNRENSYQTRYKITSKIYDLIMHETKEAIGKFLKGKHNPYYGKTHSNKIRELMKEKRKLQNPPMLGKNHNEETKSKLRAANQKQFEDPDQIKLRQQKSKKQFEDPVNRYKAGNGKRGKSWFYDPITNHSILCFPIEKPVNYIKGRKITKGGGDND